MNKDVFKIVVANVKQQCEGAMVSLIKELERRFPNHQIMMMLGVVYPNYGPKFQTCRKGIPRVANGVESHLLHPLQCG